MGRLLEFGYMTEICAEWARNMLNLRGVFSAIISSNPDLLMDSEMGGLGVFWASRMLGGS